MSEETTNKTTRESGGTSPAGINDPSDEGEGLAPEGHPIHLLLQEHDAMLRLVEELADVAHEIGSAAAPSYAAAEVERIGTLEEHLRSAESHYLREENVLFPYLEKHGITQPPAVMWMEHNEIREMKKDLFSQFGEREGTAPRDFGLALEHTALSMGDLLSSHFAKESSVLFPVAMQVIEEAEWQEITRQFDELGYCDFTPERTWADAEGADATATEPGDEGELRFETGTLSLEELPAILDTLPVDITFVDKDDKVRYFSNSKDRIFARTEAVIGREVQQCHPQKSVHVVNQILDGFRSGDTEPANFWIHLGDQFVYIRYFPVRNANGDYLGCLEVTQDIAEARALEGEKRLL